MTKTALLAVALIALGVAWSPLLDHHGHAGHSLAAHGLAAHMLQHLVVMNVAALLAAKALRLELRGWLAAPTILQAVLLWGWHLPLVFGAARHDLPLFALMQASLFGAAFLFWTAMLGHPVAKTWQAILAALVTAKAFCLFGAILCFSRRPLYPTHGERLGGDGLGSWGLSPLDDQQLAGLLMVASCAIVYVTAAVTLFVRWLGDVERRSRLATGDLTEWRPVDADA